MQTLIQALKQIQRHCLGQAKWHRENGGRRENEWSWTADGVGIAIQEALHHDPGGWRRTRFSSVYVSGELEFVAYACGDRWLWFVCQRSDPAVYEAWGESPTQAAAEQESMAFYLGRK